MTNLITFTGPFDGLKSESTMTFNGDLVSGLSWTADKSGVTVMTFTDGSEWAFVTKETKTASVLNTLVATIASRGGSKRLTFAPSISLETVSTGGAKAIAK